MNQTKNNTKMLAVGGIMIALSMVLSFIKIYRMPQGGSVTAASMVPVIMFSLVYGAKPGLFAALIYGVLKFISGGGISIHPMSILLDYILAFGSLGLAGIVTRGEKSLTKAIIGTILAVFMRFLFLYIAGVIVWGSYAPEGIPAWLHSLTYNASYMIPELIVTLVVVVILYDRIYKAMKKNY
ncbi:MAG: energy-coupled thiamine transporter ThiT [Tissierellia bacterium]|nr:energy-coupled thiamine transporter ThiT [Tissierellia bacterium]